MSIILNIPSFCRDPVHWEHGTVVEIGQVCAVDDASVSVVLCRLQQRISSQLKHPKLSNPRKNLRN